MHGNLGEYLALCLTTICGRWPRAGEPVNRPNVMLPAWTAKAQALGPYQGWGYGEKTAGARPDRRRLRPAHRGALRRDPARRRRPGPAR